jgi:lipoprotein-releasing system permease protein
MSFPWFIARRYLTARRRQAFISLISAVSIVGVGVGVMALIIALALMTGVQTELRDRIVGSTAHVYVYNRVNPFQNTDAEMQKWRKPGVTGVAPAIIGFGLLSHGSADPKFVTLKGIDPVREPEVTDVAKSMVAGSLGALTPATPDSTDQVTLDGIVLGEELARSVDAKVGDVVDVLSPEVTATVYGFSPRLRPFKVVGTFKFGFYEIDSTWAMVALPVAQNFLHRDGADMIQLRLNSMDDAPAMREQLAGELSPDFDVQDWAMLNQALYSALALEKIAISTTIGLIVMVAALNIVASLVLLVMEKSRDIAILRTMGASARVIRRIFMLQGLAIGLLGTISGAILGLVVCYVADRYQLIRLPEDVYQISHLPFRVHALDVVIVVLAATGICFLATLYPSRQAGRIDPAEALRNQ